MTMIRQYDETNFVTSLRALAATMVLVIHTAAFSSLGAIGDNITRCGKYGVEIFFVISGFSIAVTFMRAPNYQSFFPLSLGEWEDAYLPEHPQLEWQQPRNPNPPPVLPGMVFLALAALYVAWPYLALAALALCVWILLRRATG